MGSGASSDFNAWRKEKIRDEHKRLQLRPETIIAEKTVSEVENQFELRSYSSWDYTKSEDSGEDGQEKIEAPIPPNHRDHMDWLEEMDLFQAEASEDPEKFLELFKDETLEVESRLVESDVLLQKV